MQNRDREIIGKAKEGEEKIYGDETDKLGDIFAMSF